MIPTHEGIVVQKLSKAQFGTIGNDGSLVEKMVDIFNDDT